MRSLPRNALLLGLGLVVSCLDLEPIPENICGNGVIEDNESCDPGDRERDPPDAYFCRRRGTAGQCHVDCSVAPIDGSNPCPAGWGCGVDSICREPTGSFVALGGPFDAEVRQIQTADFDGDGRLDVLTANDHELKAHYFSQTGALETTFALSIDRAYPSVGDLTEDKLADIAVKTRLGVGVLRGRSDRTFSPTVYASQDIPDTTSARIVAIDALPVKNGADGLPTKYLGDEPMAIRKEPSGATVFYIDLESPNPDPVNLFILPGQEVDGLGDEIPVGQINEHPLESPCEEMVLAFEGRAEVFVVTPCTRLGGQIVLNEVDLPAADYRSPTMVHLADGRKIAGGAKLFDVNQDKHLDLVIGVTSQDQDAPVVQLAFGVGDGTFNSTANPLPPASGDNNAGWSLGVDTAVPLAIGHLNQDGALDFVRPDGIFVSSFQAVPDGGGGAGGGSTFDYDLVYEIRATPSGEPWTSARIADFNGNYLPDVIAAADSETGLDFFNGVGTGFFNRYTVATLGNVKHMAVGDFDGDVLLDVAVAEGRGAEADALSVLFGQLAGPLEPPLVMGRLESIVQIVESNLAYRIAEGSNQTLDAISEVSVLSVDGGALKLALISGSTDRLLQSPFALTDGFMSGSMQNEPVKVVIGQFTSDDHPDIAALAPGAGLGFHLWRVQATDEAVLRGTTTSSTKIASLSRFPEAIVVPVDLDRYDPDKTSLDEVAVFLPGIVGTNGDVAVARDSGASSWSIELSGPLTAASFMNSVDHRLTPGLASTAVADVDGDGFRDVVVMGFVDAPDGGKLPRAIIFWNTPDPAGIGRLDAAKQTQIPAIMTEMSEVPLNAFAVIDADADLPREIVLVTTGNTYLVEIDGATRAVGEPRKLDIDGGGDTIAVADMNHDGIEDLILANASSFRVLQQKPRVQ